MNAKELQFFRELVSLLSFCNFLPAGLRVLLLLMQLIHWKDFDSSSSDLMFGMWHFCTNNIQVIIFTCFGKTQTVDAIYVLNLIKYEFKYNLLFIIDNSNFDN